MTSVNPAVSNRPEPLPSYLASMSRLESQYSAGGAVENASERARSGQAPNFGPQNKGRNVDAEG